MSTPPEIADEDIRLLDELSGLGMAMSRDLQGRCIAVGDAREAADLALGFQRSSRSVRQTIALKAKLLRDRVRFGREDQAHAVRETEGRMLMRKAQVRLSVERAVWNETDGAEAERLMDELDDLLEIETFSDDFVQGLVETHIARICAELGVTPLAGADVNSLLTRRGRRRRGSAGRRASAPKLRLTAGALRTASPRIPANGAPPLAGRRMRACATSSNGLREIAAKVYFSHKNSNL